MATADAQVNAIAEATYGTYLTTTRSFEHSKFAL